MKLMRMFVKLWLVSWVVVILVTPLMWAFWGGGPVPAVFVIATAIGIYLLVKAMR